MYYIMKSIKLSLPSSYHQNITVEYDTENYELISIIPYVDQPAWITMTIGSVDDINGKIMCGVANYYSGTLDVTCRLRIVVSKQN